MPHHARGQGLAEYLVILLAMAGTALLVAALLGPTVADKAGGFTLGG